MTAENLIKFQLIFYLFHSSNLLFIAFYPRFLKKSFLDSLKSPSQVLTEMQNLPDTVQTHTVRRGALAIRGFGLWSVQSPS